MAGTYTTTSPRGVPEPADIPLGNQAALLTATALFIDIRQSSDITNAFRRQTAAKMLKSYFSGAVKIINANGGKVRSFNGDGMLALFLGDNRSDAAVKSAMQAKWFVQQILRPRFNALFLGNEKGRRLDFSIGCGIDDGDIYAVRIGIRGTNDVAWVGRCTNTAAKLSNVMHTPKSIGITGVAYKQLSRKATHSDADHMWSGLLSGKFGGVDRQYRTSSYRWAIS